MIMRIHHDAAVVRTTTQPAGATGLTTALKSVIAVTYATDSSLAGRKNLTCLSRRQLDDAVATFAAGELSEVAGAAHKQSTLTGTQLNVVNHCTYRDILQRKSVTYLGSCFSTTHKSAAYLQTVGSDDITLLTVSIIKQSDTS
jgi:hypothetical protein